jgi:alanyl-tRNA synthetase
MLSQVQDVNGVNLLATQLEGVTGKELRGVLDQLKNKLGSGVIILGVADKAAGKVSLIAGVTNDLTERVKAGELVNHVASQVGGKGGGRADMAQAGGSQPDALPGALNSVPAWLENTLS